MKHRTIYSVSFLKCTQEICRSTRFAAFKDSCTGMCGKSRFELVPTRNETRNIRTKHHASVQDFNAGHGKHKICRLNVRVNPPPPLRLSFVHTEDIILYWSQPSSLNIRTYLWPRMSGIHADREWNEKSCRLEVIKGKWSYSKEVLFSNNPCCRRGRWTHWNPGNKPDQVPQKYKLRTYTTRISCSWVSYCEACTKSLSCRCRLFLLFGQDFCTPIGQQWYQVIEKQKKFIGMSPFGISLVVTIFWSITGKKKRIQMWVFAPWFKHINCFFKLTGPTVSTQYESCCSGSQNVTCRQKSLSKYFIAIKQRNNTFSSWESQAHFTV